MTQSHDTSSHDICRSHPIYMYPICCEKLHFTTIYKLFPKLYFTP